MEDPALPTEEFISTQDDVGLLRAALVDRQALRVVSQLIDLAALDELEGVDRGFRGWGLGVGGAKV